jgi:NADH dehydrogenase (ubiquinone) Fe-S protein 1
MMIVGSSVFTRSDGFDLYKLCLRLAKKFYLKDKFWNGFNVLHKEVGNIGALELGIQLNNKKKSKSKVVFLLGCDEFRSEDIPDDAYVIYQGTHGDRGAERANLILPGATYVEKAATYVSTAGRVDVSRVSGTLPYLAREDWHIIRALSEFMGNPLPYDEIHEVRNRMCEIAPYLVKYDHFEPSGFEDLLMKTYENDNITVNNTNLVDTIDVILIFINLEFLHDK